MTAGTAASSQESLDQGQAAYGRANQKIFVVLQIITEKLAALQVTKHAESSREIRGNGVKTVKELESKYLKITRRYAPHRRQSRQRARRWDKTRLHQRAHVAALPTDRDGGTHHGQELPQGRSPRPHGGVPERQPDDLDGSRLQSPEDSVCTTSPLPRRAV